MHIILSIVLSLCLILGSGDAYSKKKKEYTGPKDPNFIREGGRTYMDLNDKQKRELKTMKFYRQQCFFARIREIDNGTKDPKRVARSVERDCQEHEENIRNFMLNTLTMNKDFVHDYIRTMEEDTLVSLVPYVLKYRNEQQTLKRGF